MAKGGFKKTAFNAKLMKLWNLFSVCVHAVGDFCIPYREGVSSLLLE
jgi:hypothetical protein